MLPVFVLLAAVVIGSTTVGMGTEVLVLSMLAAASAAGLVAVRAGATWEEIQAATGKKVAEVLPMLLILLAIGMLIGTWVLSGTIPLLISLGVRLVEPQYFLLTAFLVTAVMSLCTGTSWGSAGTLGVALMGTAIALDLPLAAAAGAVVSGAYFGDKVSPLSDTTNICAIGAGADLYAHIRHMAYTAGPSFLVAAVIYAVVGGRGGTSTGIPPKAQELLQETEAVYDLGAWALLPLGIALIGVALKKPAVITLAFSSLVAMVLGVLVQGFRPADAVIAAVNGFDAGMVASLGQDPASLSEVFLRLLERGGLNSMAPTLVLILSAFLLAGAMEASGALDLIMRRLLAAARGVFGLVASTMAAGAVMISLTSHGGVTALIVGGLFQDAYRERRLAPENLSRSLEDSVTIVEPLLPWTVSALYMATTLGVSTAAYAPWAVFCYGGPVFSLLIAALYRRTGVGIQRLEDRRSEEESLRD